MKTLTIHRLEIFSLIKFGFIFGLITSFLPITFGMMVFWWMILTVSNWLGSLTYQIPIPFPGIPALEVSVVDLLKLEGVYTRLQSFADTGLIQILIMIVLLTLASAVLGAFIALIAGLIFNILSTLSGGLRMTVAERIPQVQRSQDKTPL